MTSMNVWARSRTALSLAALLALVACGGGGGDSSSGGGAASTVAVSGVASKGLLAYAKVTAYAVNSNGTPDTSKVLGSAITDANGAYTITGLPPSTPVILEVTPLAAEGTRPATTMKDEATGTDVEVPVASGFSLSAAVVLDASGTATAPVTPLTDMALKYAQTQAAGPSAGVPIADVIRVADEKIAEAMGVALNEIPAFDADGAPTNEAAVKLAAVSELAQSECAGAGATLDKIQCAIELLRDEVTDAPVAGAPLLSDAFVTDLNAAQDEVDVPAGVTVSTVENVNTEVAVGGEAKTAIQDAKDLIASVRATTNELSNEEDAKSLASRVRAIEAASYGVAQPLDDGTVAALQALSEAITKHQDGATGAFTLDDNVSYYWIFNGQQASGCSYFVSGDFVTESPTRTQYLGCKVAQHVGWDGANNFVVYHLLGLTDQGNGQFEVQSSVASAPVDVSFPAGANGPIYEVGAATPLGTAQPMTVTSTASTITASGRFAPGAELQWSSDRDTLVVLGTHQVMGITLSEVTTGALTRYNMSGDVSVYDGADIQSRFSIKPGSFVEGGDDAQDPSAANLIIEAQLKDGYKFGGTLVLSDYVQTATRTGATKGSLQGYLTDMAGAKLFDGTLTLDMPTNSRLNWEAKLDGTLVTTGTNTLAVSLTAKQSATVQGDFTATGRYTQGTTTFLLTLQSSESAPTNDQLSLSTPSGVGFTVTRSAKKVDIMKAATKLGVFDVDTGRLDYVDGTYERF